MSPLYEDFVIWTITNDCPFCLKTKYFLGFIAIFFNFFNFSSSFFFLTSSGVNSFLAFSSVLILFTLFLFVSIFELVFILFMLFILLISSSSSSEDSFSSSSSLFLSFVSKIFNFCFLFKSFISLAISLFFSSKIFRIFSLIGILTSTSPISSRSTGQEKNSDSSNLICIIFFIFFFPFNSCKLLFSSFLIVFTSYILFPSFSAFFNLLLYCL